MINVKNGKNPCPEDCPVRLTADILEHKWATVIIRDLLTGKKRFSELEKSLESISPKVLSDRLRELEKKNIVLRTVYSTVPPTTDYELTNIGKELEAVIRAMHTFGKLLIHSEP